MNEKNQKKNHLLISDYDLFFYVVNMFAKEDAVEADVRGMWSLLILIIWWDEFAFCGLLRVESPVKLIIIQIGGSCLSVWVELSFSREQSAFVPVC